MIILNDKIYSIFALCWELFESKETFADIWMGQLDALIAKHTSDATHKATTNEYKWRTDGHFVESPSLGLGLSMCVCVQVVVVWMCAHTKEALDDFSTSICRRQPFFFVCDLWLSDLGTQLLVQLNCVLWIHFRMFTLRRERARWFNRLIATMPAVHLLLHTVSFASCPS